MVLPSSLLKAAKGQALLVELKNGETYNGTLQSCDQYMNLTLTDVVCTSRDADKFWKIESVFIRGVQVKYLCVPQEVIALVKDDAPASSGREQGGGERGGGGRGRGRGRGVGGARDNNNNNNNRKRTGPAGGRGK